MKTTILILGLLVAAPLGLIGAEPAKVAFVLGPQKSRHGDVVVIQEVLATSPNFAAGDKVVLRSPSGRVEVGVEIQPRLPAGVVFFPEHFNTPSVKDLIAAEIDPITRVIYHKQGPVAIERGSGDAS